MRTSVGRRMAEKTMSAKCDQAIEDHYKEVQARMMANPPKTKEATPEQRACLQASRAFIKCEGCDMVYADAEYKINGVGSSIYLCRDCYENGGDLEGHEQLELIERIG